MKELYGGVYSFDGKLATKNLAKGRRVYNEDLIQYEGAEYRTWNPYRSKLAAAILNGLKNFRIDAGNAVLYLGAATGTTASHVSDVVGEDGRVYCVEISERNMRELIKVCESRGNMLPLLGDAMHTERYSDAVIKCDAIYQDVSARDQALILKANSVFLKKGGYAYFVIKSQSIDISRKPKEVFDQELAKLEGEFEIIETLSLEPFDSMHLFAVLRRK
jgi:fibrillarin-like pre-rRNA processing protein